MKQEMQERQRIDQMKQAKMYKLATQGPDKNDVISSYGQVSTNAPQSVSGFSKPPVGV